MCLSNVETTIFQLQWEADIREAELDRLVQVEKKFKSMEHVLFLDVTDDLKISLLKTYLYNDAFQRAVL